MNLSSIDLTESGNVQALPVKPRPPVGDRMLNEVMLRPCGHYDDAFDIDTVAGKCECRVCGQEVSPMFVLERLCRAESRWMQTREAYLGEMKRLGERSRTKCEHCGKMTRISRS